MKNGHWTNQPALKYSRDLASPWSTYLHRDTTQNVKAIIHGNQTLARSRLMRLLKIEGLDSYAFPFQSCRKDYQEIPERQKVQSLILIAPDWKSLIVYASHSRGSMGEQSLSFWKESDGESSGSNPSLLPIPCFRLRAWQISPNCGWVGVSLHLLLPIYWIAGLHPHRINMTQCWEHG